MTKAPVMLLAVMLLGLGACGGARTDGRAASHPSAATPRPGSLMGDQDKDSSDGGYYDGDDGEIRDYGQPAGAADSRAIASLVKRYYSAAAVGDGAQGCALTYYFDVETLPEQYGQPPGPLWLKGADTCRAVLSRVFTHFHAQLSVPVVVTGARVSGNHADALVGFRTLPAGFVKVRREGRSWKIDGLLAAPLP